MSGLEVPSIRSEVTHGLEKATLHVDSNPSSFSAGRSPIVTTGNFLIATRDSGYKTTSQAISELVDNAIQAFASHVWIHVVPTGESRFPIEISVQDDGKGMTAATLAGALSFGGSSRFDDRSSLGRYGMGLPNSALSRSRRVEVYSWRSRRVHFARLDLDEIIDDKLEVLAPIETAEAPPFVVKSDSGTFVRLCRCDRLEYKRPSFLIRKLREDLGRIFRHFLLAGLELKVCGQDVIPVDHMLLSSKASLTGARQFGDQLVYQLPTPRGDGQIGVLFSELPVDRWHSFSSDKKRTMGITNTPSVSIVRAGREIDRGWFLMGSKRRENYDDWWRCEITFDPTLDEHFGITHTKQSVSPSERVLALLEPDLEPIARALNGRVRRRFESLKAVRPLDAAEKQASRGHQSLPKLPRSRGSISGELDALVEMAALADAGHDPYRIVIAELSSTEAFEVLIRNSRLLLFLNSGHPLYRDLYGPLARSDSPDDQEVAKCLALALLAAARAESSTWPSACGDAMRYRRAWGDTIATFFNS